MSVIEMEKKDFRRKVTRVGNSLGVTIPSELLHELGIQLGDEMDLVQNDEGDLVLKKVPSLRNVRPETVKVMAEAIKKYDNVLRILKDK